MNCPLCENQTINKLETINKDDLVFLYKKMTRIDFGHLISQNIDYCECQKCKLRFFSPLITGDEQFYNVLQKFDWYYMDDKDEYIYAKNFIKPTDKVLEVGSGKGAFAKHLLPKNYTGLDFSIKAKEMAAKNGIKIENEMVQDYAEKFPASFDIVVSFQVLEHVSDPKAFIEAKIKALKEGGKMIIAVPSENSYLKHLTNGILNMPPHHVTRWSDETLKFIADRYNLDLIELFHEKVQKVHRFEYLSSLIQCFFMKSKNLDISWKRKIVMRLGNFMAKFFLECLNEEVLPNGHTVVVIFQKRDTL